MDLQEHSNTLHPYWQRAIFKSEKLLKESSFATMRIAHLRT